MEILHSLASIVTDLSRRSEEILKEGVELLKNYEPIVDQVLSIQTHLPKDRVKNAVREEIIGLLCDAQHTQNEIKLLANHLAKSLAQKKESFGKIYVVTANTESYDEEKK